MTVMIVTSVVVNTRNQSKFRSMRKRCSLWVRSENDAADQSAYNSMWVESDDRMRRADYHQHHLPSTAPCGLTFFGFWVFKRLFILIKHRAPFVKVEKHPHQFNITEAEGEVDEMGTRDRNEVRDEVERQVKAEEGRNRMREGKVAEEHEGFDGSFDNEGEAIDEILYANTDDIHQENIPLVTFKDEKQHSFNMQPLDRFNMGRPHPIRLATLS
ncbi:hypothetical protein E3P89_01764 [Wallemia ichthyophaga]|uniref:Uncharacterized protein n=1 Tax=Wallemia ichthyophaga TaxID=245174 RepID=A0A4T0HCF3_WALIC|nr:hypothetical protein E3P91_01468 [Wallemia ichthyophaga]TIA81517.1 hypothetical protein E3P98_01998 [Wallemia ichthyophaga]TIA96165.1 hypothetical protein E3P95_03363 [Wallemia ichthyophaga]TIA97252.1 hypothetical protein E3P94_03371 [Wallemia ichthyophaga]TIB12107.1 hypothetical protein E3P90_02156 [Wallemia ichthyophaga]